MPPAFSPAVQNALEILKSTRRKNWGGFPRGWDAGKGRISTTESLHDWFKRCVDRGLGGQIEDCTIEDNLAVFVVVHWRHQLVSYINFQALVTIDASLVDFYLDDKQAIRAHYLRLDYDLNSLGEMFREPAPHIHVRPDGEPRHSFVPGQYAVVDFFDFLYRNYCYQQWLTWADTVWRMEAGIRGLNADILERVQDSFKAGNYEAVKQNDHTLKFMKTAWRTARNKLSEGFEISTRELEVLSYEPPVNDAPYSHTNT